MLLILHTLSGKVVFSFHVVSFSVAHYLLQDKVAERNPPPFSFFQNIGFLCIFTPAQRLHHTSDSHIRKPEL